MIISFDFDDTLSKPRAQKFARYLREKGHEIWIVTSRMAIHNNAWSYGSNIDNSDLYYVALNLGIDYNRIHFTNYQPKAEFFKDRPEFFMHFENDPVEIHDLKDIDILTIDVRKSFWINNAMAHIASGMREEKKGEENE